MSENLRKNIGALFDEDPSARTAAQKNLQLDADKPITPDLSHLESRIWREYTARRDKNTGRWANLLRSYWLTPAVAFASALLAVLLTLWLSTTRENVQLAKFDYAQNSLNEFAFQKKMVLLLRQAEGLEIRATGDHLTVDVRRLWGQFEFEKKPGNSLAINTPFGTFSVTGTRFQLYVTDKEASLRVEEGVVQVQSRGEKLNIGANEQFSTDATGNKHGKMSPGDTEALTKFRNAALTNQQLQGEPVARNLPKKSPHITVELFDGNSVSGIIQSENAEAIVIQPRNFKAVTVRKNEIKASKRD